MKVYKFRIMCGANERGETFLCLPCRETDRESGMYHLEKIGLCVEGQECEECGEGEAHG